MFFNLYLTSFSVFYTVETTSSIYQLAPNEIKPEFQNIPRLIGSRKRALTQFSMDKKKQIIPNIQFNVIMMTLLAEILVYIESSQEQRNGMDGRTAPRTAAIDTVH